MSDASTAKSEEKLTTKQYAIALFGVAKTTYRAAPVSIVIQVFGSLITALLPIVTTFFAALTTTSLAAAYAGDTVAGSRAIELVLVTAGLGIGMTIWQSLENYITKLMRYRVESAMTDQLYEHFLSLEFWQYDDKDVADNYEKARKFAQFFPYIFDQLSSIMTATISMIGGVIALLLVNWIIGLIALVAIIPGVVIQFRLSRAQTKHWKKNIETRRIVSWIEWGLMRPEKIAEIRLYGLVRHLLDLRMRARDKDQKVQIEFERKYIGKKLAADIIESGAEVAALVWITLQIIAKQQPIGQFIFVQQIVSRAIGGAGSLVSTISSMDQDIANLFDYQRFMALPVQVTTGSHKRLSDVETIGIQNVSFSYPGSNVSVLKDVSISVTRGQRIAIVGENGAGKSTLVKIISGLYVPTHGDLTINGTSLTDMTTEQWHKQIAVLGQDFIQYDFATVRQNIEYGDVYRKNDQANLDRAIDLAEAGFLRELPKGLDNYVDKWMEDKEGNTGQDLSGGQWQRLALARNFYRDAPIIILDEPTSAIDALAETRIFNHLFSEKNKTIIAISHRLTTVKKADMIYMLKAGKIVEQGSFNELLDRDGEFVHMFKSQL